MTITKRILFKRALSVLLFATIATSASAQQRIAIGTASTGSNPYVVGSVMAKTISEHSSLDVTVQSTGGYNENLGLVSEGKMDIAFNFIPELVAARAQEGKYASVQGTDMFKNLRLLFPVYLAAYHYMVREDSGITTFEELKGHSFNVNLPSTATYGINMDVIEALGYKPEDFRIVNLSGKDTYDALRNRLADASGNSLAIGGAALQELAASVPVRLLDISDVAFAKLNAKYKNSLVRTRIPANTYPGQTTENLTYSVPAGLFTTDDADEETIYQFTKAYWENWEEMTADARTLKDVDVNLAASMKAVPLHPGAERYFRERGLIQ